MRKITKNDRKRAEAAIRNLVRVMRSIDELETEYADRSEFGEVTGDDGALILSNASGYAAVAADNVQAWLNTNAESY